MWTTLNQASQKSVNRTVEQGKDKNDQRKWITFLLFIWMIQRVPCFQKETTSFFARATQPIRFGKTPKNQTKLAARKKSVSECPLTREKLKAFLEDRQYETRRRRQKHIWNACFVLNLTPKVARSKRSKSGHLKYFGRVMHECSSRVATEAVNAYLDKRWIDRFHGPVKKLGYPPN